MNVTDISISRYQAREKWLQYSRAVKESHDENDELLRRAYRELSLGKRVINWQEEIAKAGLDPTNGLPRLGITRPTWEKVCYGFYANAPIFWNNAAPYDQDRTGKGRLTRHRIAMPVGSLPFGLNRSASTASAQLGRAVAPLIPPQFRPATKRLERYAVLFEPTWESLPKIDPILLLPIGGGLGVVCAQWDMTPLERSVLFGK